MSLTLAEATRIAQGAISKAEELGCRITVAVCDSGGRLVTLARMDNAVWASTYSTPRKAAACAGFGFTGEQLQRASESSIVRGIITADGGNMLAGGGCAPIIRNGLIEGGCSAGGGTAEEDDLCVEAGIARL